MAENRPFFYSAMSTQPEAVSAATRAVEQVIRAAAGREIDLCFVFVGAALAEHADQVATVIRERLGPRHLIGTTTEGMICGGLEAESTPGVTLFAASLPGVRIHTFTDRDVPPIPDELDADTLGNIAQGIGAGPELRATLLFVDAFSVPMVRLLPAMNAAKRAAKADPSSVLAGGLASGATGPGQTRLILGDEIQRHGMVGVSLSGNLRADAIVSQGCRPIGQPFVVTKARGNLILQLGGRPALDVVQETVSELSAEDQEQLHNSLLIGRVVNEYKDRFGRSDFLIRNIIGVDKDLRAVAVGDIVRPGITVQLQLRDAETASQDLLMLLDAQQLHDRPVGAMMFTCVGRGSRLFSTPNHDALRVIAAFASPSPGEAAAKPGTVIAPGAPTLPLAGCFSAGEIGPVGGESYLHGQTASVVLFRT